MFPFPVPVRAPENLVSRDGFGSPVPRQPAHLHTQAKSGGYKQILSACDRRQRLTLDSYKKSKNWVFVENWDIFLGVKKQTKYLTDGLLLLLFSSSST